jgi:hypothetical protein
MTRIILALAALALSGCQLALPALPTPAEICAMPAPVRDALADSMGSTPEAMALACAVVK